MRVWIDADSCPKGIRDVTGRACKRLSLTLFYVANREIPFEEDHPVTMIVTDPVDSSADNHMIANAVVGDLVITRDIPLAAALVEKSILVINDRGNEYTRENIRERLSIRDFMAELRLTGQYFENRHGTFGKKEIALFAATLDKLLTKVLRAEKAGKILK